jgi:hypothetical protein
LWPSAAAAGARGVLGNVRLVVCGGIIVRWRAAAVLQKGHSAQARFGFALVATGVAFTWIDVAVAIGLKRLPRLTLLLLRRTVFACSLAPTLIVALTEATHALDHAEIVIGILPIGFRQDAVARSRRLARQCLVFVEHLMGIAAHADVGTAAIEDLVAIGRAVGVVMLLVVVAAATATPIATAARPLPIV